MSKNDFGTDLSHSNRPQPITDNDNEGQGLMWQNLGDFYCNFFDLIGVMAIMIDDSGTVRLFNKKAGDLTGYSKEESIGQDWFSLMLPEQSRANARDRLITSIRQEIEHLSFFMPVVAKGGAMLPVCWSMSTVRDDDGRVFGMIGLGYVPAGPDAPCVELSRLMNNYGTVVGAMTHDLLNHSQVALGYVELAMERSGEDQVLHCMLNRACKALKKCGDIAGNVHKISYHLGPDKRI